ncbi:class I SAM-dependent rRNA methyltransferase [Deinococcus cellulosilyticus]|uniref:S-adenosylmethionine-dependent methyltransferase domain-containing protein n=1 Tax=Deinococcus cellulosilyticus (strain DSM 18568 / NBRC 106333 / KACC 11606 / 5516J-15) TaxID=1223518 RepID=A0A511N599_DEIC1|nr:class I SAM-dependent methyltransferase [Deinococcus cellulosilyticus]GEM48014.1 hypothetical protein DC3_36490 [Deinococcus cellulosilyticus NBRC 106333 = KACC 11606]
MSDLAATLTQAWNRRKALNLLPDTTFFRALHLTESHGMTLDVVGQVGILSFYQHFSEAQEQTIFGTLQRVLPLETVYLKRRPVEARHVTNTSREWLSPEHPIYGPPQSEIIGLEQQVKYLFRPGSDLSVGLFADMRLARQWVREQAAPRVLNTFSYTCGFGLNATLGGSQTVKNVDASRKVLEWGKENYTLNGCETADLDFIYGDVQEWLKRFHKREDQFDLIVLDPPSFSRSKKGIWRAETHYGQLVSETLPILSKGGMLLACCNHAGISMAQFKNQIRKDNPGLKFHRSLPVSPDFPAEQESHLKITVWGR